MTAAIIVTNTVRSPVINVSALTKQGRHYPLLAQMQKTEVIDEIGKAFRRHVYGAQEQGGRETLPRVTTG